MLAPDFFGRLDAFLETLPDKGPSIVPGERVFVRVPETLQHIDTDFLKIYHVVLRDRIMVWSKTGAFHG